MTKELEKRFAKIGCQEGKGYDALVVAKYFHPLSSWTLYATEYDQETRTFFGYVTGLEDEWGYFSLDELESTKVFGLGIERDMYFKEMPLREVLNVMGKMLKMNKLWLKKRNILNQNQVTDDKNHIR
jgi:hypothetical protein